MRAILRLVVLSAYAVNTFAPGVSRAASQTTQIENADAIFLRNEIGSQPAADTTLSDPPPLTSKKKKDDDTIAPNGVVAGLSLVAASALIIRYGEAILKRMSGNGKPKGTKQIELPPPRMDETASSRTVRGAAFENPGSTTELNRARGSAEQAFELSARAAGAVDRDGHNSVPGYIAPADPALLGFLDRMKTYLPLDIQHALALHDSGSALKKLDQLDRKLNLADPKRVAKLNAVAIKLQTVLAKMKMLFATKVANEFELRRAVAQHAAEARDLMAQAFEYSVGPRNLDEFFQVNAPRRKPAKRDRSAGAEAAFAEAAFAAPAELPPWSDPHPEWDEPPPTPQEFAVAEEARRREHFLEQPLGGYASHDKHVAAMNGILDRIDLLRSDPNHRKYYPQPVQDLLTQALPLLEQVKARVPPDSTLATRLGRIKYNCARMLSGSPY